MSIEKSAPIAACLCAAFEPEGDGEQCVCGHVQDEHGRSGACEVGHPDLEGWGFPVRSTKAHYMVAGMSLCRRYGFFRGPLETGQDEHSQNCVECKKLLAKRKAARS